MMCSRVLVIRGWTHVREALRRHPRRQEFRYRQWRFKADGSSDADACAGGASGVVPIEVDAVDAPDFGKLAPKYLWCSRNGAFDLEVPNDPLHWRGGVHPHAGHVVGERPLTKLDPFASVHDGFGEPGMYR